MKLIDLSSEVDAVAADYSDVSPAAPEAVTKLCAIWGVERSQVDRIFLPVDAGIELVFHNSCAAIARLSETPKGWIAGYDFMGPGVDEAHRLPSVWSRVAYGSIDDGCVAIVEKAIEYFGQLKATGKGKQDVSYVLQMLKGWGGVQLSLF